LEESDHGITELFYWNFLAKTEESHVKPQSGKMICRGAQSSEGLPKGYI
jgi:hypothetical protein